MEKKKLTVRAKYTLGGAVFGLSFPIFSQFIDAWLLDLDFSLANFILLHKRNVIHYVVDTAPFVLGVAGYLLGTTHQKKNDINESLRKINESLDTLTYKITHDLRGPALNIKNLSEILKTSSVQLPDEKKEEVIVRINQSIDTWLQTFEDFMALLKHEKSGQFERSNCSLEDTLEEVMQELANDIEKSGAEIISDFSQAPSAFVYDSYLKSIFKNLLSNSIKYAHSERNPQIKFSSCESSRQAKITVSDNGMGMDLEVHGDRLFTLFERFSDKSQIPGSGVGLYLVKQQIEKNNGDIEVDSIPNEGTIFTIHLPLSP